MDFLNEIEDLAKSHPDQAVQAVEKAEQIVEEQTGHRFDDQVKQGGDFLEGQVGIQQQDN